MATIASNDRLVQVADHPAFILGAYFIAFFPWGVMSNIDFISEKWRTVRRTRHLARWHMVCSILPMFYVGVYAEAQRRKGDIKEYGAALVALGYNLSHVLRTVVGVAQLNVFVSWCTHALDCVRVMKGEIGYDHVRGDCVMVNPSKGNNTDSAKDACNVEELMVNNTVVDNELGGTDVTVTVAWKKVWECLRKGEWKPSVWLRTEHPWVSTVRWSGAFLCAAGGDWRVRCLSRFPDADAVSTFFSTSFHEPFCSLQSVYSNIGREKGDRDFFSLSECIDSWGCWDELKGAAAYGSDLLRYKWRKSFKSYALEFDNLRSSYPSVNESDTVNHREGVTVELVDLMVLAKQVGLERLAGMRRYYERNRPPTNEIWRKAWSVFSEQCDSPLPGDSEMRDILKKLDNIPLFPYRLQLVTLWEQCSNWRVLQASAQGDIGVATAAVSGHFECLTNVSKDVNIFNYGKDKGQYVHEYCMGWSGVVLETVRTFLADWIVSQSDVPEWEPILPTGSIEFPISDHVLQELDGRLSSDIFRRLIWECQSELQDRVARMSKTHPNLPASEELVMLFFFAFTVLDCDFEFEDNDDRQIGNNAPSESHTSIRVSVSSYRLSSPLAPQHITVRIRFDYEARKVSLALKSRNTETRFIWQDWINAAMGFAKGMEDRWSKEHDNTVRTDRVIRETNLREPMLEFCPRFGRTKTEKARIWMGWPPFDVRICKFEVDQWLSSCGIDIEQDDCDLLDLEWEVERAEAVIKSVVAGLNDET